MTLPLGQLAPADVAASVLFYLFAAMTAGSAVALVATRNIVRSAVALLLALLGVAGLYFLLHAEFLAAVQLVIYAGGTLILIVFGVMLTSNSPFSRFQPTRVEAFVAGALGLMLLAALSAAILAIPAPPPPVPAAEPGPYPMARLGQSLLGDYLIPFELASVMLLVVMIGAAYLAKARRRQQQQQGGG